MKKPAMIACLLAGWTLVSCGRQDCYECPPEGVVCQTYVHKYGVEVPSKDWRERGQDGIVVSTLATGSKVSQTYVKGTLQGDTTYTFPHSEVVQRRETYTNNILSKAIDYAPNGRPLVETVFLSPQQRKVTEWYDTGSPRSVEEYDSERLVIGEYFNPANQTEAKIHDGQGTRIVRDAYGIHQKTETIEDGLAVLEITFYPNNRPKEQNPIVNGVIQGERKTFLPSGEPNTVETWKNGKQTGITTVFQNGVRYKEVPYLNGVKEGIEKRFGSNNQVVEEISWANDLKHGPSITYVEGTKQTEWYYKDHPVSKTAFEQMGRGNNPNYKPTKK